MPPWRRGLFRLLNESSSKEEDLSSWSFLGAEPTLELPFETASFLALDQERLWRTITPQNKLIERLTPETTETWTSYDTAPELSEPIEHLFDTLLKQEWTLKQENTEILTIQPKQEMLTNVNMGGPSGKPFRQAQPLNEETTKVMEIKLNQLKPFSGKQEDLKKFL